ncbi:TlpA family protein disulfide reductase [Ferruginibacter sp. SUN002]|uniref:TlpA family protein disulfide reductase n=1 Tax=Ferruginibacter sp. SUN002 TaxID=2937789 RepID=UPI003D35ABD2
MQKQKFTKDSIQANRPTLFILYNSDCEHCQYEASEITKFANAFKTTNILFISNQPYPEINQFDSIYHLTQYPFIKLLKDSTDNFYKIFGTSVVPSLIIYNSKSELVKNYKGEVNVLKVIDQLK